MEVVIHRSIGYDEKGDSGLWIRKMDTTVMVRAYRDVLRFKYKSNEGSDRLCKNCNLGRNGYTISFKVKEYELSCMFCADST